MIKQFILICNKQVASLITNIIRPKDVDRQWSHQINVRPNNFTFFLCQICVGPAREVLDWPLPRSQIIGLGSGPAPNLSEAHILNFISYQRGALSLSVSDSLGRISASRDLSPTTWPSRRHQIRLFCIGVEQNYWIICKQFIFTFKNNTQNIVKRW